MAIIDNSFTGSLSVDRDQNTFIGIELPFYKSYGSEGYFASTKTTLEAVKNDIINLIQTQKTERILQPELGINLRSYLFEQVRPDLEETIKGDILSTMSVWLPFVDVQNLIVDLSEGSERNTISVSMEFKVRNVDNMLGSVQINI